MGFAKENGCDVLVSEIELSGINGLTLAEKIQNLNPKVNIIFLTVCDEKEHAKEVLKIRPSGYLVPPQSKSHKDYHEITCEKHKYLANQPHVSRIEPTSSQKTMNQTVKTMHRIALVLPRGLALKNA